MAATLYFGHLAYRIVAPPPPLSDTRADRHPSPLIAGILISLADPKANASTAALFLGFILIGGAALDKTYFDLLYTVLADCATARLGHVSFDPTEALIAISARNEGRRLAFVMPKNEGTRYAIRFVDLRRDPRRACTIFTRGFAKPWLVIALPSTSLPPD